MKPLVFVLGILAATAAIGSRAEAQNYPWCAYYDGGMGGGENCGFTTIQQCMADISGIGGLCQPNTQYQPPPRHHPPQQGRHKTHTQS
jgi:Protein of unknown function (DUF3551)